MVSGLDVCVGTAAGCTVWGGAETAGSVLAAGAEAAGWGVGSVVAVVAGGGVSREITGAGCAAGLPGARMAGAAGAAVTADVKKEKISTMAIVLICFFIVKFIKSSTYTRRKDGAFVLTATVLIATAQ